jgi:hypothetical protein
MSISRRCFLLWSCTTGLLGQSQRLLAALVSPGPADVDALDSAQSRCLQAWLDTLLPADEFSPAASELGMASRVVGKALGNPDYLKLIRAGCHWLDRQALAQDTQSFARLDVPGRERVVRLAEQAKIKSLPRLFFEHTREDAFTFYYTQPETWAMLDYPGPPQPGGFMDHTRPPASRVR